MIRNIKEIHEAQNKTEKDIASLTINKFGRHIELLNAQCNALSEFLANYYDYGNTKHDDSNQFILCFSLLSDSLRKERVCIDLILRGYYNEVAELARHIMQSSFQIIYISKNKESWKEWFKQQDYEEKKLTQSVTNPRTIFFNFWNFLTILNEQDYYKCFQKLSSWSHPSIESMRSVLELKPEPEQVHKYFITTRYDEMRAEFLLNIIYGFIDRCVWDGFKDLFVLVDTIPYNLQFYKKIQDDAARTFDIFYSSNSL